MKKIFYLVILTFINHSIDSMQQDPGEKENRERLFPYTPNFVRLDSEIIPLPSDKAVLAALAVLYNNNALTALQSSIDNDTKLDINNK